MVVTAGGIIACVMAGGCMVQDAGINTSITNK
jgi:hypothetical protein